MTTTSTGHRRSGTRRDPIAAIALAVATALAGFRSAKWSGL